MIHMGTKPFCSYSYGFWGIGSLNEIKVLTTQSWNFQKPSLSPRVEFSFSSENKINMKEGSVKVGMYMGGRVEERKAEGKDGGREKLICGKS